MDHVEEIDRRELAAQTMQYASAGKRFVNNLVDGLIILLWFSIVMFFIGMLWPSLIFLTDEYGNLIGDMSGEPIEKNEGVLIIYCIFFIMFFGYYLFFEYKLGKTVGKMLTKTRVVSQDLEPLTLKTLFLRTLIRLIPFEVFSFLGSELGWHDQWTNTCVVLDNSLLDSLEEQPAV